MFESKVFNYRLDLSEDAYTYVNFSEQVPDASFAAMRFQPNAFSLVIVEDLGAGFDSQQYAEMVAVAMSTLLDNRDDAEYSGIGRVFARASDG